MRRSKQEVTRNQIYDCNHKRFTCLVKQSEEQENKLENVGGGRVRDELGADVT